MRNLALMSFVCLVLLLALPTAGNAQPVPVGTGTQRLSLKHARITVFTYRPNCHVPSLLLVFHGQNRNAADYRDWARPLADQHCMLVVAPEFEKFEFPRWRYQHGGIAKDGELQPSSQWTGRLVLALIERIRQLEGRMMTYSLIGHSAGGQYLSRLAAFTPTESQRIVIANPGTHVLPDPRLDAPYGFGGVYPINVMDKELRRYLSAPVTIYLGSIDTGDEGLSKSSQAIAQGPTRYARGINAFEAAQALARARGWPFNWRLVEVPGVGHRAKQMFAAQEASHALKP